VFAGALPLTISNSPIRSSGALRPGFETETHPEDSAILNNCFAKLQKYAFRPL
jgi:hypothetical protein